MILSFIRLQSSSQTSREAIKITFIIVFVILINSLIPAYSQKYTYLVQHSKSVHIFNSVPGINTPILENNVKLFLDAINRAYLSNLDKPIFPAGLTDAGLNEIIENLWNISHFCSINPEIYENLLSTSSGTIQLRNIQILYEEADSGYAQQDVVIIFNKNGKIVDFKITLEYNSVASVLRYPEDAADLRRKEWIINFVDNLKTSYYLKDIYFLSEVFSDNTLYNCGDDMVVYRQQLHIKNPDTIYKFKLQNDQYLKDLRFLFSQTRSTEVVFDSLTIVRHMVHTNLFGISIKQILTSRFISGGRYYDVGYVFLVIDLKDEQKPRKVLSIWQDSESVKNKGLYSFNNFRII